MTEFESILTSLLSSERAHREPAESRLQHLLKTCSEQVLTSLLTSISSPSTEISLLSALLVRTKFTEEGYLHSVSSSSVASAKAHLLGLISPNAPLGFLKKIGDILLNLSLLSHWELELMGLLANWSRSDTPYIQELSLYLFENASVYSPLLEIFENNSSSVAEILWRCINSNNTAVSLAAVSTLCRIMYVTTETCLPPYIPCFDCAVQYSVVCHTILTIGRLSEVTEKHPRLWTDKLQQMVGLVTAITRNPQNPSELRMAAVDLYVTLFQSGPGIANNTFFLQEAATLGFLLLAEPEQALDLEAWAKDLSPLSDSPFSLGRHLLKTMESVQESSGFIRDLVLAHLQSSHWVHQNAGITAYPLTLSEDATPLLVFTESMPRLQWALLGSLGVLCMETLIINTQHHLLLPAIEYFLTHPIHKIQIQALSCLSLYCTSIISNELATECSITPYLPGICNKIYTILGDSSLLQQALNSLSLLIDSAGTSFLPYSSKFYAGLTYILSTPPGTPAEYAVRAECIRCIGCLIKHITDISESTQLLHKIIAIKNSTTEEDSAVDAAWDVLPQFAEAMQAQFLPFAGGIVSELIYRIELDIDIHALGLNETLSPGYDCITIHLAGFGEKSIAMNSVRLQVKIKASESMHKLIKELKAAFNPWIQQTCKAILPLLDFPYSRVIRKNVLKSLALFHTCEDSEYLLLGIVSKFSESLRKGNKIKVSDAKMYLKYLAKIFSGFGSVTAIGLSTAQLLSSILAELLRSSMTRKVAAQEQGAGLSPELHFKELKETTKKIDTEDAIMSSIMEIIASLLDSFKKSFQSIFLSHFHSFFGEIFYNTSSTESEILTALCLFCDYIEHTGDVFCQNSKCPILEQFIKYAYHPNPDLRQTAASGIGLCAQCIPEIFTNFAGPAAKSLQFILELDQARSSELLMSSESAAGALGKIAVIYNSELIPQWLDWLPLKTDAKEARESHLWFLGNLSKLQGFPHKVSEKLSQIKTLEADFLDDRSKVILSNLR